MTKILLFIDSNIKTIPYEVPLLSLKERGYTIVFLSILKEGPIHEEYRRYGFPVLSMGEEKVSLKKLPQYVIKLKNVCRHASIDVVFAHLAIPSLAALLVKPFIDAKVVCFRHHFNFVATKGSRHLKVNRIDNLIDKINARLASTIIIPSNYLKELINKTEGVRLNKMKVIPYAYDWNMFIERTHLNCNLEKSEGRLKLLVISRLTELKRPALALELLHVLRKDGSDVTLTVVGTGDLMNDLHHYSKSLGVSERVQFVGFQSDVTQFIRESDILIHPSLTEASSSVVKEAGILGKPVIVCNGVGDFNDYIVNDVNSWSVDPDNFVDEAKDILSTTTSETLRQKGFELKGTVERKFSLTDSVVDSYISLLH